MNNKTSSTLGESSKDDARLNTLVEQLKSKLINFILLDRQGELIGEVKDLILDTNRQLNLVVSPLAPAPRSRFFLLNSKLLKKVEAANKSALVNIAKAEIEYLPEYVTTQTPKIEVTESRNAVKPALVATDSATFEDSSGSEPSLIPASVESKANQEQPDNNSELLDSEPEVLEEELIRLLGERVVVARSKRKIGEVIVRKEIETRMVQIQVPVRHEKLIVEQVSPERKQLAEIDLGQVVTGIDLSESVSQALEIDKVDKLDEQL